MRAASIAAELLDFYREPALVRTRYLHGEIAMPDGAVLFRLALARFASAGLEALPLSERAAAQLAAIAFVRQVCLWDRASHYQVLALERDAQAEQVRENYHLLIALIHPDRHDGEWPAGSAPRVNQAYAVLSDADKRRGYDEQLDKAAHEGAVVEGLRGSRPDHAPQPRPTRRRPRMEQPLARFAVVAGVVAALFMVQAWFLGASEPQHYSLLQRAIPVADGLRKAAPDAPRFLGHPSKPGEMLALDEEPKRVASLASWLPVPEMHAAKEPSVPARAQAEEPAPAPRLPAQTMGAQSASIEAQPATPLVAVAQAAPPPARLAQASPAPAPPPTRLAQASPVPAPPAASAPNGPSREQVEGLVSLLVSYYDAGDSERLVALHDPERLGFWSGMRTRSAYADFFGATRERRLRIERLDWQSAAGVAQARGEAIVLAEYLDGRARLERRVPVELDIVMKDAQPRISRMVLFPLGQ
jgi:hypothetical protein